MDPGRLLLFRTVARAGSLSAAARELATTQPAVSQQLRLLEREAGLPLALRGARGITLTEAGQRLLMRADEVAAHLHMADEELAGLAQLGAGRVRLVAFPSAAATLVPDALQALTLDHPGVGSRWWRQNRRTPRPPSVGVRRTWRSCSVTPKTHPRGRPNC